jgi:hypothetical protein
MQGEKMGIYKIGLDKRGQFPIIRQTDRQTDSSISLSFFPAHNFITPDQGARCVHGFSVGVARPFAFLGEGDKEWIK